MQFFDGAAVDRALSYPALVDVLEAAFRTGAIAPLRHHHAIALDGRPEATLLLMPAWQASAPGAATAGRYLGVKSVTVFPDNATPRQAGRVRHLPAVLGRDRRDAGGDGRRPGSRPGARVRPPRSPAATSPGRSQRLLMVGAGVLAPQLIRAHASVRPIREVAIWNRSAPRARDLAARLADTGLAITVADDLETAVRAADIVSTATISSEPLVRGAWLRPGTHVDCVGAYRPGMRETDDEVVRRARIFVDTRDRCLRRGRRHPAAHQIRRDRQGGRPGRSLRSLPRHVDRPPDARGDHPLQVRRRGDRGPRRRRRRLRDVRW